MIKCSANYCYSNNNFVINGIDEKNINSEYLAAIKIIKNIINRGTPTKFSLYLNNNFDYKIEQDKIYDDNLKSNVINEYYLISSEDTIWDKTIKGSHDNSDNPALEFFNVDFKKYLGEYGFIRNLILPECPVNDLLEEPKEAYNNRAVDFYLPQANLVIEIDGSQHINTKEEDKKRDSKLGIKVIRIPVYDLKNKTNNYLNKMSEIKEFVSNNELVNKYKNSLVEKNELKIQLVQIIRLQFVILELLKNGIIDFNNDWNFDIRGIDEKTINLAINDLLKWFELIFKLQKLNIKLPKFNLGLGIKIDIDVLKRYDDTCFEQDIIYVRNDYFENYNEDVKFESFTKNYYQVETSVEDSNYPYKLNKKDDEENLKLFLKNIFGYDEFNEGQLEIIINILNLKDTIGILPTGSGKSLCYQIASLLQPGITIIICPLKSLIKDQRDSMVKRFINNNAKIVSGSIDSIERRKIIENFSKAKYQMLWVSPERFQSIEFRNALEKINSKYLASHAIIDEVHCMSEWGHSFRTSYLHLVSAINKFIPSVVKVGLTATATSNVMRDLIYEFDINNNDEDEHVITTLNFLRTQLEFVIINCKNEFEKDKKLKSLVEYLQKESNVLEDKGYDENGNSKTTAGLIFDSFAGGSRGCYSIAKDLQNQYKKYKDNIGYFVGKDSINVNGAVIKVTEEEKIKTQDEYKADEKRLLVATKAFGMGIDKDNIRYVIHFGIPNSIEELYQEVGRAGRRAVGNKLFKDEKSLCYILHTTPHYANEEERILFNRQSSSIEELKNDLKINGTVKGKKKNSFERGDVFDQLEMFLLNMSTTESEDIYEDYLKYIKGNFKFNIVTDKDEDDSSLASIQKSIYKLSLLNIIEDWTVTYGFNSNTISGICNNIVSEDELRNNAEKYILKYDSEFNMNEYLDKFNNKKYNDFVHKYIDVICTWYYENIIYSRRQAIMNVDEMIQSYQNEKYNSDDNYKSKLYREDCTQFFNDHIKNYFNPDNYKVLLKIIDDKSYDKAIGLLYNKKGNIDFNKLEGIKATLERIVVEKRSNPVINILNGIVSIYLNKDKSVYLSNFKDALEKVLKLDNKQRVYKEILESSVDMDESMKQFLSEQLVEYFNTNEELILNYNYLKTEKVLNKIVLNENDRLTKLKESIF